MSKLLWILSIVTLPLLMVKYYRFAEIPATHLFLLAAGLMNIGTILKLKSGKIEKVIYSTFILFIVIAFFDLIRTKQTNIDFIFEFKLIVLLITIKLYSFFMSKFGINLFIKWLSVSSGLHTCCTSFCSNICTVKRFTTSAYNFIWNYYFILH